MIAGVVDEAARRFGARAALVSADGAAVSYEDLARLSHEVAAWMVHHGVGEGDVVSLVLPSIPEHVIAYIAASRIGAITAGVNARLTAPERDAVVHLAQPKLVITTPALRVGIDASQLPDTDHVTIEPGAAVEDMLRPQREPGNWVEPLPEDPDRPLAIVFTSGTTGTPKGAVFSSRQLDFITLVDTGWAWGGPTGAGAGASLAGTSFAHLGPTTKLPGNLVRGGTTHLMHRWTARAALEMVERHRMPGLGGIPTQIALMLRDPDFAQFDLSCVRAIVIGGGPSTASLVREARERFAAALSVRYACTEAGVGLGTAFDAPDEDAEVSVGRPHDGVLLSILDGDDQPLPDGEVGEVCLRSPAVMSGYWHDPEGTRAAFAPDGSVRTGDLGFIDEAGRLRLVGRSKEMYVRGGYNVYPVEVEQVLADHPDLVDVAIVPRPDDVMGEVGVAVVVPSAEAVAAGRTVSVEDLRGFGHDRLAAHKLPEAVIVVDELPLTPMEKVDRRALQDLVAGGEHPR